MLLVRTFVGQSTIEGLGVFSGEFIASGSLLWALDPKFDIFIEVDELKRLPAYMREYIARYGYPHMDRPGVTVLDSDNGKFMNHTEQPNTDFRIFDKGYALVDIAEGDEITCNYHEFDPTFTGRFASPPSRAQKVRAGGNGKSIQT
jgi:SET domain-containing protein